MLKYKCFKFESNVSYQFFVGHGFGVISKKFLPNSRSQVSYFMFSSISVIILSLILQFLVRFELIFEYNVGCGSKFFSCSNSIFPATSFVKKYYHFPH